MKPTRPVAIIALVLLAGALLGGCGSRVDSAVGDPAPRSSAPAAYGDTFIEALLGNISGLIPNVLTDASSFDVAGMIYSGLVTRDRELNIIGELAESWEFSKDCLDLTFRLRQNVRWHDGHPLTADDVVFTYETMIHPKTPTAYREDFYAVERAEAVDPHTVHIRYKKPYAKALQSWGIWILPRHLLEPYVREGRLREAPQNRREPVGTGPYRLREWKPGEKVVLTANPDYFLGRPYISRLVYRIIPSQATIFLELKAKGIDAAGLTALQYRRQTEYPAFRKAYNKFRYPANVYTYFGFNLRDPRFADKRVRQAFAHAINKQELMDGVLLGFGREATGPYKPGTWAYNGDVKRYPYDMARARALLAEAGWKDTDGDGLLDKDGRPFRFELLTNQGNEERKKVAEIIQASLKELGVEVEIRILEWAAFLKEYIKKRRFEAIILGWGIGLDPDQYEVWHSSKTGPDELNHISYANPEVDQLLEKGRTSCVQEERVRYYHRLQEILAEDQPIVFLYFRDALPVVSSRVHGVVPSPNGIRYNFPEWYVPKHLHRYTSG
ncbi:MAG: peptide-binding protein [Candidatus Rokubacteria bacterium]|nr:peptide-binding protein [Candidatus Rokubacteria bacterium]